MNANKAVLFTGKTLLVMFIQTFRHCQKILNRWTTFLNTCIKLHNRHHHWHHFLQRGPAFLLICISVIHLPYHVVSQTNVRMRLLRPCTGYASLQDQIIRAGDVPITQGEGIEWSVLVNCCEVSISIEKPLMMILRLIIMISSMRKITLCCCAFARHTIISHPYLRFLIIQPSVNVISVAFRNGMKCKYSTQYVIAENISTLRLALL